MSETDREEIARAREYALRLLDYRDRSVGEMRRKLADRRFPAETAAAVISDLTRLGLLDDERFARLWVRSRLNSRPRSGFLLALELARKGVSRNIIDSALKEALGPESELDSARSLARRQAPRYRFDPPDSARRKLEAYLARRGYRRELIEEAMEGLRFHESSGD